ncbi:MAG: carboxypeptidase-like regulatory domain-containing protein [Pseudomonadota bacterium]
MGVQSRIRACLQKFGLISLLVASFAVSAQSSESDTTQKWTPGSQDLRLLEVKVKQYTFDDFVTAYQFEDIVLLPIGAISELIDVAVEVRSDVASGFILREDRPFYLDTTRNQVTRNGVIEMYDPDKVHVLFDDIYVESNLLGNWFGMSFNVDLFAARITLISETLLPFESRIERDRRVARALSRLNQSRVEYPRHHEPYETWSTPFVDQTFRIDQRKTRGDDNVRTYQYTTYATADVARLEAALYFSGNETDKDEDFRLTLGRKEPDGGLLGPLDATEFSFGHLAEPRIALINQPGTLEPGVSASSFPLGRQIEFDRHRFIGELLPGWEVELYRNNALIGYQAEPIDGQYDFQDVPLLFGNNHFRLVFYGPQGQIRNEESRFDLNQSLTRAGEGYYRMTSTDDEDGGNRSVLQFDRGLSKRLSASANLASIPLDDGDERVQHQYLNAGLRSYWDSFFVTFDVIDDNESGDATQLNLQTRWDGTVIGLEQTALNEFFSEEFRPTEVELSSRSRLSIDTAIPPGVLPRIPLSFEFKRDEFADGGELLRITNQIFANARGLAISNQLVRQEVTDQDPTTTGTLQLSGNYSGVRWRGSMSYELDPDSEFTSVALTADPGRYGDYRLSVGLTHTLEQDLTEVDVSANKSAGRFNLSLGARVNNDDEFTLSASLSVSFGQEPRSREWFSSARTVASTGNVSARVFLDGNQDGVFNEGDEPLPEMGFRLNGGYNPARSNDEGIVFLTGLPAHQKLNIAIAPETIADPLWSMSQEGVQVVPRPGRAIALEFPIFVTGEIDGTVYLARDDREFGVGRVNVELVDLDGNVVQSTLTAYDGFFVVSKIPVGDYYLRISPDQQQSLGLVADEPEFFSITTDNLFLNGIDFVLREK